MMYTQLQANLRAQPQSWLVTGAAGFIGSNLVEALLQLDQRVTGLDNFATGHQRNLDEVRDRVSGEQWARFKFIEGDIRDLATCQQACEGVDRALHQAALGSVPRSLVDPITSNEVNVSGHLNMLAACRDSGLKRFVYAASSSTYGNHPGLPKVEHLIGKPLSPYAVTKYVNELYADVFAKAYGLPSIGLRYFNVFGARQDPDGAYAAVIPRWISALIRGDTVQINGDGETSRDFCYIDNVVQANLLAAMVDDTSAVNQVYNIAVGDQTSLNRLFAELCTSLGKPEARPQHCDFRAGDVRHSRADISKAQRLLGYAPTDRIDDGLKKAMAWYVRSLGPSTPAQP